jgi:Ca-activated chloride channel family protein
LVLIFLTSNGIKRYVRIIIIAILVLINFRFMTPNGEVEVQNNNLDVIFVVDTTLSMNALDYNGGKRLDAVKKDIEYIVDELSGSSFSLISYDSTSSIKLPFTRDSNAIKVAINTLRVPDSLYASGSDITLFKNDLLAMLDRSIKKEDRKRIVFIISDGEITADDAELSSLIDLRDKVDGGAVLGYGTDSGGKMEVETYRNSGKYEYVKDRSSYPYKEAVSKIDETNLNKMADDLGISYVHMTSQNNVNSTISDVRRVKTITDSNKEYAYSDTYYYFSFLLIPLILFELILDRRIYR